MVRRKWRALYRIQRHAAAHCRAGCGADPDSGGDPAPSSTRSRACGCALISWVTATPRKSCRANWRRCRRSSAGSCPGPRTRPAPRAAVPDRPVCPYRQPRLRLFDAGPLFALTEYAGYDSHAPARLAPHHDQPDRQWAQIRPGRRSRHRCATVERHHDHRIGTGAPVSRTTSEVGILAVLSYRGFAQSRNRWHRAWPCHRPATCRRASRDVTLANRDGGGLEAGAELWKSTHDGFDAGSRATKTIQPSGRRAASTRWICRSRMSGMAPPSRRKTRTIGK